MAILQKSRLDRQKAGEKLPCERPEMTSTHGPSADVPFFQGICVGDRDLQRRRDNPGRAADLSAVFERLSDPGEDRKNELDAFAAPRANDLVEQPSSLVLYSIKVRWFSWEQVRY